MITRLFKAAICGLLAICCAGTFAQGRLPSTTPSGVSQETHDILYEADVQAIIESDRTLPPPDNGILFIGSSIFRQWESLERQMDPLPVFNRAFGGSRTWELLHYMNRLVLPYKPAMIVYYCGSNDINAGETPDAIQKRFVQFCDRVYAVLPKTRLFFVSIIRAPQKMSHWDDVDKANNDIRAYCQSHRNLGFINVNPMFTKKLGQPRMEVFQGDGLHLVPEAYAEMAGIIKPIIEKSYRSLPKQKPSDKSK